MGWRFGAALSWCEIRRETQITQQENPHCCKKGNQGGSVKCVICATTTFLLWSLPMETWNAGKWSALIWFRLLVFVSKFTQK